MDPSAYHVAIQMPLPSLAKRGTTSVDESIAALAFNAAGVLQVMPLFVEREYRMSQSVPMNPPRESVESQTVIQTPLLSVAKYLEES
jgi:hypothetical protein